jgi:hypothetical protein
LIFKGSFFEITQNYTEVLATIFLDKSYNNFDKSWIGLHFGRLFSQTHLVTLSGSEQTKAGEVLIAEVLRAK